MRETPRHVECAVVGGGPAGLMAAEALRARGVSVHVFDAMPSLGRKFLMAGKSGLNLTHSEPTEDFLGRYGEARPWLEDAVRAFDADAVRNWARDLGVETFTGTSGRVFPHDFKAAPLLRAWLRRLRAAGVVIHARHKWRGWGGEGALAFDAPAGPAAVRAAATVLALGGASWPGLGSDGAWVETLRQAGGAVVDLRPANCGFDVAWSNHVRETLAGQPLKSVRLSFGGNTAAGDVTITETGIESGPVYALSAALRDACGRDGHAVLTIDLAPDRDEAALAAALARPRGKKSWATHLKRAANIAGAKAAVLRENTDKTVFDDPARLAHVIKGLELRVERPRPLAEAISSAGGVRRDALDAHWMLKARPGVFCAGEMLDWEAPTGGYLLTACFALGRAAGNAAADWLDPQTR
ncbi:MAG: TIGR03862 family flavoprotein [Alphaproteobacteria bacterium]|nr:TIGR03862 family flavoprotein [Alphaproteobacteria bacterium]